MSNLSRFLAKTKLKERTGSMHHRKLLWTKMAILWSLSFVRLHQSEMKQCVRPYKRCSGSWKAEYVPSKLDTTAYINDLIAESIVEPDLYNKELQDSYGVKTPENFCMP